MGKDYDYYSKDGSGVIATKKILILLVCMIFISSIFHNVSAVERIYTIEDSNSNVTINPGEKFNISLEGHPSCGYVWDIRSSNSSVLRLVDEGGWVLNFSVPGSSGIYNWTYEGHTKGTTTLTFVEWHSWVGNDSIINIFTLNVTSNVENSTNILWPIIIVVTIIVVVPTVVIIKWMKGGRDK